MGDQEPLGDWTAVADQMRAEQKGLALSVRANYDAHIEAGWPHDQAAAMARDFHREAVAAQMAQAYGGGQ